MRRSALTAMIAALVASPLYAGDELDCDNAQTQIEMNLCAALDHEAADRELNLVWGDAMARAEGLDAEYGEEMQGAAKALLKAQRAWINYRDGNCELAGWIAHGGTMEPMLVSACLADMTRARTKELRAFVDGTQG